LLGLRSSARPFSRSELLQKAVALPAKALGLYFEAEQKTRIFNKKKKGKREIFKP
jgi:hypothetical protein